MCGHSPCNKPDCTWSEQHRFECEARFVVKLTNERRNDYFKSIARKRGDVAMERLKDEARKQWVSMKRF